MTEQRLTGAILISGRGSNMAALLKAARDPAYPVRFTRVIANREDATGLALAREEGVEALCVPSKGRSREAFEADLTAALGGIDLVCLGGFMRVLSAGFVARWPERIVNVHPSLLPAYPGLEPHARALAAGERESGCTVHIVTPEVDAGPMLAQARVPVEVGDDADQLAARILREEHLIYPPAVAEHARSLMRRESVLQPHPALETLREECGVFAMAGNDEAAAYCTLALHALQHRGQEGAGIVTRSLGGNAGGPSHAPRFHAHKAPGLVGEVFSADANVLPSLKGDAVVGHVRYATCGGDEIANIQPLLQRTRFGAVALAHNGNLTNAGTIRAELIEAGQVFQTSSDTEVILHLIARSRADTVEDALAEALAKVTGAYALVVLTEDALFCARDPSGVRPLVLGRMGQEGGAGAWVAASETCALEVIGAALERDVEPGETVRIAGGDLSSRFATPAPSRFCVFEYIYFMRANSAFRDRHAAHVRERIGARLFREAHEPADVVVPVPESGVHAAVGYAEAARLPFKYGILKSAYVGRTFIEPSASIRNFGVRLKLSVDRAAVAGRRVLLVDDSIVRANTMPKIVDMLRAAGAREVHVRIAAPPFRYPCFYGVDTPLRADLSAANHSVDEIRDIVGCDSLAYISLEGLREAVGGRGADEGLCHACFSGQYDVPLIDADMRAELETSDATITPSPADRPGEAA